MDIILCHCTADFDTLGAAVGVTYLRPGARILLCGGAHPTVREFLALYRDEFPLIERRSVNPEHLHTLIVVDTQQRDRLGTVATWLDLPQVQVELYDHHPQGESDIDVHVRVTAAVGAATTLVAEALQQQQSPLPMPVATVMALGIHMDTGSLTYAGTTVRDAAALTWLMQQGANQRAIATYTEPVFSADLQALLGQALEALQTQSIYGYTVTWILLPTADYIPGLARLTSQLMLLCDSDCLLFAHLYGQVEGQEAPQRLSIIGRSRLDGVDLNALLQPLGGGGHARAAAATLKTQTPETVVRALVEQVIEQIPRPPTAADLMSAPVRTIRPTTTINQARRILLRYGHSGLSVVNEQDQLAGIVSRRDLDIALHHGFGHAPVKGYMTAPVRTIGPDTLLPDIELMMVTYDIGRLPVVDQGQLVGIVTRTDILRQLHQLKHPVLTVPPLTCTSIQDQLRSHLQSPFQKILSTAATAAAQQGWQLYLVGGVVRDLLLAGPEHPFQVKEFDLVVDGVDTPAAGVDLGEALQQAYPDTQLQVYGQFQTASLIWPAGSTLAGFSVDIATARSEFYPYPAANPEVEASSIRQDLYRRDFTINALAVRLTHPGSPSQAQGELLDFFGGTVDLQDRQIRVLHPNSFIEDPTRIFRAVRFATRLGFGIEEQTERYIRHAIASGIYAQVQAEANKAPALQSRLRNELKYIFQTPHWARALRLLSTLDALQCIHPQLQLDRTGWRRLRLVHRGYTQFVPTHPHLCGWLLSLEVLIATLPVATRTQVAANLHLPEQSQQRLERLDPVVNTLETQPSQAPPSTLSALLAPYDTAMLILVGTYSNRRSRRWLWQYLHKWSTLNPLLTGKDLIQLGYQPGRQFKPILAAVQAATLDGELTNTEAALQWVKTHFPR